MFMQISGEFENNVPLLLEKSEANLKMDLNFV